MQREKPQGGCATVRSSKFGGLSGAAAPQDDGEGATRLRKYAISCSIAQLGAMENLAAQVFPQACRRNADTKHVKDCMWMWLRHGGERQVAGGQSKIHHSSFVIRN